MEAEGSHDLLAEQEVLAASLQSLGHALQRRLEVDPGLATQTIVAAVRAIRTWLESGMVLVAIDLASRDQLALWEEELLDGAIRLGALSTIIRHDLDLAALDPNGAAGKVVSFTERAAR